MPLEEFLSALAKSGVRPAFENAQAYEDFWTELRDKAAPGLEAADRARILSEQEARMHWLD